MISFFSIIIFLLLSLQLPPLSIFFFIDFQGRCDARYRENQGTIASREIRLPIDGQGWAGIGERKGTVQWEFL